MKKSLVLLGLLLCFVLNGYAQPDTLWTKVMGTAGFIDGADELLLTSDGGYIVGGGSGSFGGLLVDSYLAKLNSSGDVIWENTYPDPRGSSMSGIYSIKQTSDGGYIGLSQTYLFGGNSFDGMLVKTDASGNEEWIQTYDGGDDDRVYEVEQTPDGGYAFVGGTAVASGSEFDNAEAWLVKTDASGNIEWEQHYGENIEEYDDWFIAFDLTSDGGYALYGFTDSYGLPSYYMKIIKADAGGNEEWSQTYGGDDDDYAYDGIQTADGGYILCGVTMNGSYGESDAILLKTDADGNEQWSQVYGDVENEYALSIKQDSDGGYIVGGTTESFSGGVEYDFWLFKTDASGNQEWSGNYGGEADDDFHCVILTAENHYLMGGSTVSFGDEDGDILLICAEGSGTSVEHFANNTLCDFTLHAPYPNPFNPATTISYNLPEASFVELTVFDIRGREVAKLAEGWTTAGSHQILFNAENLASGVYFYRLNAGEFSECKKMLLVK